MLKPTDKKRVKKRVKKKPPVTTAPVEKSERAKLNAPLLDGILTKYFESRPEVEGNQQWQALFYFNIYRMVLSAALVILTFLSADFNELVRRSPQLFLPTAILIAITGAINLRTIAAQSPPFKTQAQYQIAIDMLLIVALVHFSSGVDGGLGMLLLVTIAVASTLLEVRVTLLFAALATGLVILEHTLSLVMGYTGSSGYTKAGLLGIGLFAAGLVVSLLYQRAQSMIAIAEQQQVDLDNMDEINRRVVARLKTGVIVIDNGGLVRSVNAKAQQLLKIGDNYADRSLKKISMELGEMMDNWSKYPGVALPEITLKRSDTVVAPVMNKIGDGHMIFLEDVSAVENKAREAKLAAIGRLAASIAHEIRNPLSAISHAGQLLAEGGTLEDHDKKLVFIVQQQSQRINRVVEAVLQFTKENKAKKEPLRLKAWLEKFSLQFCQGEKIPPIAVKVKGEEMLTEFDPAHLKQVLTNLGHNAVRHSPPFKDKPLLEFRLCGSLSTEHWLDVIDFGAGIAKENRDKVFEPFFTTHARGTGLGLFISRELCHSNGASLQLIPTKPGATCFRIKFDIA